MVDVDCRPNRQEGFQTTGRLCSGGDQTVSCQPRRFARWSRRINTLFSLIPLLILILMALSHIVPEDRLLLTLSEYLEFDPGQSAALVEEVRTFLAQKQVVGSILFVTMLFF